MVSKISGKQSTSKINHLQINNSEVTYISDIANTLGQTFSDNSSSEHYSTRFKSFTQNDEKKQSISFESSNSETYNSLLCMDELTNAISKYHNAAVGQDSIHYQILKRFPDTARTHYCML